VLIVAFGSGIPPERWGKSVWVQHPAGVDVEVLQNPTETSRDEGFLVASHHQAGPYQQFFTDAR